jgi:hypothetical protein
LVSLLKFMVAKNSNSQLRVLFHKSLYIHFRLPKTQVIPVVPIQENQTIQYSFVATPKPVDAEKKKTTIYYDITLTP